MKKFLILTIALALASCDNTVVYTETGKDFKDNRWLATDVQHFEFELKEDIEAGNILMMLSHVHEPQFTVIPVEASVTYPSGESENVALSLVLKDAEGNDLSECLGDVCDFHTPIKEKVKLAKGKYRIALHNNFPNMYLPNTIAVGVRVETAN